MILDNSDFVVVTTHSVGQWWRESGFEMAPGCDGKVAYGARGEVMEMAPSGKVVVITSLCLGKQYPFLNVRKIELTHCFKLLSSEIILVPS